jgi:hypothetical protein
MRTIFDYLRGHSLSIALLLSVLWIVGLRLYYSVKPLLPRKIRLWARRWLARRRRARSADRWPILERAGVAPENWTGWPEDRMFAFALTHDVESQRGLDRVRQLADLEMSLGFRSCFNFIPEGPYRVSSELRHWLIKCGFEVGVHDYRHDGKLYQSRAAFSKGASRINHYLKEWNAAGFRSGFMFHNLEWIKELNVQYDSSTFDTDPFEPQPDGVHTIFPFWVGTRGGRGYVELPYTLVQDSTLFVILQEKTNAIWKQKLGWIQSRGGMALLNVHPDYIHFGDGDAAEDEFPVEKYSEFLSWVKQNYGGQYWHAIPRGIADFCRKRTCQALAMLTVVQADSGSILLP